MIEKRKSLTGKKKKPISVWSPQMDPTTDGHENIRKKKKKFFSGVALLLFNTRLPRMIFLIKNKQYQHYGNTVE